MRGCKSEGVCFSLSGFCWVELTVKWRVDGVCVCVCELVMRISLSFRPLD